MPILPLDHPEPLAATLGVMLYPGKDEDSQKRARACAAQFLLADPIRRFHEAGDVLAYEDLLRIASDSTMRLDDLEERLREATAVGNMVKVLFALANANPSLASWGNAAKVAETIAAKHMVAGSRSYLYTARTHFISVAHLWGAWSIRDGRFVSDPDVGYEGWHDFEFFLAEAEMLRWWGQSWRRKGSRSKPPLPAEVWRMPDDWAPPERRSDWPRSGGIPDLRLPVELLADLRETGRPRKAK